jgi:hypothetical protein
VERHVAAGDGGGAGAAIGLEHVAIDADLALAQRREIGDGAQTPADQALDLVSAAGLTAARGFAVGAGVGRARQHAVFRRHPAAPGVAQKGRRLVLDRGAAQHAGIAERGQARAFGVFGGVGLEAHGAHRIGGTARRARHGVPFRLERVKLVRWDARVKSRLARPLD